MNPLLTNLLVQFCLECVLLSVVLQRYPGSSLDLFLLRFHLHLKRRVTDERPKVSTWQQRGIVEHLCNNEHSQEHHQDIMEAKDREGNRDKSGWGEGRQVL